MVHRCFHAIPPLATKDGVLVNAVYGFITTLFKAIKDVKPTHVVVTFDVAGGTFRNEAYAEYKATRTKAPDELYAQIPFIKEFLAAAKIPVYEKKGFEADDVIGTIVTEAPHAKKVIVTGDMDTLQLVDKNTVVYTMRKGINDTVTYDAAAVHERFGFEPPQMIDYKALRGDTSDNIKGVKGIGEKTGMELIKYFGTIENLYEKLELAAAHEKVAEGLSARVQKVLLEHKSDALLSKELVTIVRNVPIDFNFDECAFDGITRDEIFPVLQKFEFLSLLNRLPGSKDAPAAEAPKKSTPAKKIVVARDAASTHALVAKLQDQPKIAVHFMRVAQQDLFAGSVAFFGFSYGDNQAAVEVREESQWDALGPLFMDKRVGVVAHDVKQLMHELAMHGITVAGKFFDIMVAAYLLQAGTRAHDLPNLVITILGEDVPVAEWTTADGATVARAAARVARIAEKLGADMEEKNQMALFTDIEMPLVAPLTRMERYGVLVDPKYLEKLHVDLTARQEKITARVYGFAGHEFNIASPQQVSEVLFEELKLSTFGIKRGKTGISTAAGELEKLKGTHEIIDAILEHREVAKLLSTYVDALPKLIAQDGRVHTSYNQVVVATGRLSSSNPNLQNIPVRSELGRDIRRAFIAADGYKLLSCDYSQIELRIVAHLAQDKKLIEIFEKGEDVHKATAAEIHGVPLDQVTKEMRFSAKEVNFGVLYGMGAWGLAERTGISQSEARAFIEKYFATFTGVAAYVEGIKKFARENGYVETMFGRRRYMPEMHSGVAGVRAAADRMAVNMPIQGTQADIVKKAMIAVDEFLVREYGFGFSLTAAERACPARMILQVHDELIFEIEEKLVKDLAPKIVEIMNGVAKLSVPLKVDSAIGNSWADLD